MKTSEPLDVYINNPDNPVTQLTINSKVDKEVRIEAAALSSTPEGLLGLFNTYKYLEMKIGLEENELEEAVVYFTVPQSWLQQNGLSPEDMVLHVNEEEGWKMLKTEILEKTVDKVSYKAEANHFSYFAISAKDSDSNLLGAAITDLVNGEILSPGPLLLLLLPLIVIAGASILVWRIKRKPNTKAKKRLKAVKELPQKVPKKLLISKKKVFLIEKIKSIKEKISSIKENIKKNKEEKKSNLALNTGIPEESRTLNIKPINFSKNSAFFDDKPKNRK